MVVWLKRICVVFRNVRICFTICFFIEKLAIEQAVNATREHNMQNVKLSYNGTEILSDIH